eukprot:8845828-Alexandrium_andersonii.AAC.1
MTQLPRPPSPPWLLRAAAGVLGTMDHPVPAATGADDAAGAAIGADANDSPLVRFNGGDPRKSTRPGGRSSSPRLREGASSERDGCKRRDGAARGAASRSGAGA